MSKSQHQPKIGSRTCETYYVWEGSGWLGVGSSRCLVPRPEASEGGRMVCPAFREKQSLEQQLRK